MHPVLSSKIYYLSETQNGPHINAGAICFGISGYQTLIAYYCQFMNSRFNLVNVNMKSLLCQLTFDVH